MAVIFAFITAAQRQLRDAIYAEVRDGYGLDNVEDPAFAAAILDRCYHQPLVAFGIPTSKGYLPRDHRPTKSELALTNAALVERGLVKASAPKAVRRPAAPKAPRRTRREVRFAHALDIIDRKVASKHFGRVQGTNLRAALLMAPSEVDMAEVVDLARLVHRLAEPKRPGVKHQKRLSQADRKVLITALDAVWCEASKAQRG